MESKKTRVLFDASPLLGSNISGVGYYTKHMVESLAVSNDDIELVGYYFNFLGRNNNALPTANGKIDYKEIRFIPGRVISVIQRITGLQPPIELLVARRFDYLLFTNYVSYPSLRKTPQISVVYDLSVYDCPEHIQKKNLTFLKKILPKTIRRAHTVVTISEFTKKRLLHYFPGKQTVVTPIPPVVTKSPPQLSRRLTEMGIRPKGFILFLGTIEPRKNISLLLDSYELLPAEKRNACSLVLAGGKGWNDEEILARISELRNKGLEVITTGYVSDDERSELYSQAAVFCMPSHYEGFGMPILEAMVHEVPIVASDIEVFKEIGSDSLHYAKAGDSKDFSSSLNKVLSGSLKKVDYAQILEKYSWLDVASKFSGVIKKH